jgi:hypothetical protein
LSQGKVIEKSGSTIEWVEKTVAILDERRQEKLAIKQRNPEFSFARLDRDEHIGVIRATAHIS